MNMKCQKSLWIVGLIVPVALCLWHVFSLAVNVPVRDDIPAVLGYLALPFDERMSSLFDFYSSYRIPCCRMFFNLQYALTGQFDFRLCIIVCDLCWIAFVLLLAHEVRKVGGALCALPFVWLMLDLWNWENLFWAGAAVQNEMVLVFALVALICFDRREKLPWLGASFVAGFICTGFCMAGSFIWPAFFAVAVKDYACSSLIAQTDLRTKFRRVIAYCLSPLPLVLVMVTIVTFGSSLLGYFDQASSFNAQVLSADAVRRNITNPVVNAILFVFAFAGNLLSLHWFALPFGVIIVFLGVWLVFQLGKIPRGPIFGLLVFMGMMLFAVCIFRSCRETNGLMAAMPVRYRIFSLTIIACVITLATSVMPLRFAKIWQRGLLLFCVCAVGFHLVLARWSYGTYAIMSRERVEVMSNYPPSGEVWTSHERITRDAASSIQTIKNAIDIGLFHPPVEFHVKERP